LSTEVDQGKEEPMTTATPAAATCDTVVECSQRAVIFTRARSLPHAKWESVQLEAQERYCRQVAGALGATVVQIFAVHGGTTETHVRRVIEALLSSLDSATFDYLIVQSLDRLARRPGDLARIAQRLTQAGTRLVTSVDPADAFLQDISAVVSGCQTNERRFG
jgi:DNA invertase Pin-like site-specific DNA recombinase